MISHLYSNGEERLIAYASRTLTQSECNYAQLEKEALSLIFGLKKFHQYLYGRKFQLLTDHKPLTTILGPKSGIPSLAASRLQRWALILSDYQYEIQYRNTKVHGNADSLSRLPLPLPPSFPSSTKEATMFNIHQISVFPITAQQIASSTMRDPVLSKVLLYTKQGWPSHTSGELQPYRLRQTEITVEQDCLLWGVWVIIPSKHIKAILEELHQDHSGIVYVKSVARSYVWWPGIDRDLESLAKSCPKCQSMRSTPAVAPLHPWLWPTQPWDRIHVDFTGPCQGRMLLVVTDAHSKWPEVFEMKSTTTSATIRVLRSLFARYGLPHQLVSDSGPQFTAAEFSKFLSGYGIKHVCSSPYHPSSNGAAERLVSTLKRCNPEKDFSHKLAAFLLGYCTTPHSTTNVTPVELFLK